MITTTAVRKTTGLLLKAFEEGKTEEIIWTEVTVGDLVITVAADALKATVDGRAGVRLPVTHNETVTICRALDCVAPTQAMCDAMFAQAKGQLGLVALVRTAADSMKMTTVDFTMRFHEGVEKQLTGVDRKGPCLIAGAWKYWLLHPRLSERGAVNYGFWDKSRKPYKPVQTVGGRHDAQHYDYSQLLQPVKRIARRASTGEKVDLIEHIIAHDRVPALYVRAFDKAEPQQPQSFVEGVEEVDLLATLQRSGVDAVGADGWEKKGRTGFTPEGIMVHHTAGPKGGDAPLLGVCVGGRPDLPGPLCHIYLTRSGKAHVLAANIANHAGPGAKEVLSLVRKSEPVTGNARDHKYADSVSGNPFFYGIEVENSGTERDPYPGPQIEALGRICAAICQAHDWSASRVIHHRQWTARKIDMSYRGDLPGIVAQYMDSDNIYFGVEEDPSEPMWEPDPDLVKA